MKLNNKRPEKAQILRTREWLMTMFQKIPMPRITFCTTINQPNNKMEYYLLNKILQGVKFKENKGL
jgi:hypothetical protein